MTDSQEIQDLCQRPVQVFFSEQFSPSTDYSCVHSMSGQITTTRDEGFFFQAREMRTTQRVVFPENEHKGTMSMEEYSHLVFIPWSAVKYIKIEDRPETSD